MVSAGDALSVVIVSYRRADLLARALEALAVSTHRPRETIVVDVDPVEPLTLEPPVRAVTLAGNPGYAAACNAGAAAAGGGWLLFMNDDVFVSPSCIGGVLSEASADPAVGIATPRLLRPDGRMDHACHRGLPSVADSLAYKARLDRVFPRSQRLGHYRLSWLDPLGTHDVEACTGAFMLTRREALEAVGGWDEAYRFYAEDLDLCARVAAAGWRIRYVGTETATHVKGSSSHLHASPDALSTEERATRRRARAAAIDSHERFYRRHMEAATARPLRPLVRSMFVLQRRLAARGT
jgi:GT2 family glycosyltransferase